MCHAQLLYRVFLTCTHRCQFKEILVCVIVEKSVAKWRHLLHNVENYSTIFYKRGVPMSILDIIYYV